MNNNLTWRNEDASDKQIHLIQNLLKEYDTDLIEALEKRFYKINKGLACDIINYLNNRKNLGNVNAQRIKREILEQIRNEKPFYFINTFCEVSKTVVGYNDLPEKLKKIGNEFDTEEEAQKVADQIRQIFLNHKKEKGNG